MYSTGIDDELEFNYILDFFIQKNLFTKRQISIIYNKKNLHHFKNNISLGAYYRQVKQCKIKYERLIYTILLFRLLNLMDSNTMDIIESIVEQIGNLSQQNIHHKNNITIPNDIIHVIDQIVKKTSKI
ncbi:MAG TPA: hypothetical protein VHJ38_03810 [Nitrososphaeraceae archaeon]|nr:hypothetical protein [Nitrososphaeraceae archaeon]